MTNMEIIKEIRITRNKLKKSMLAAALVAAGVLFASTPAQATIVDLINGDSGTINGAQFDWTPEQPTGTGNIQPLLRGQADGAEQGYNTSGTPVPFDDKVGPWTHHVPLAHLQSTTVMIGTTSYPKL